LSPERVVCTINPGTAASIRVANRCGFRQIAQAVYKGEPTLVLERVTPTGLGAR
jgi:RimJ/RimL family protein N-acetyltransferase